MKTLKNLVRAALAAVLLSPTVQLLHAQGFCEWIGDGLNGQRYQEIRELIPMDNDLAFAAWNGDNDNDMETFVGRVSTGGNLIWSKTINLLAPTTERANAILRTQAGNLIVASNGGNVFALAKFRGSDGFRLASKSCPGAFEIVELFEQPNGNIIAFGTQTSNGEVAAMMFDANLNFLNGQRTGVFCTLKKVIRSNNGVGFFGVGVKPVGILGLEGVVFHLFSNLSHDWTQTISTGNGSHTLNTIGQFNGGSVVVAGHDGDCENGNAAIVMHVFDPAGLYLGSRVVSEPTGCIETRDLRILPNGNIVVTGRRGNTYPHEIITVSIDNQGNLVGGTRNGPGTGNTLTVSNAGQLFIGGHSVNMNGKDEGYLSQTDLMAMSCCSEILPCSLTTPVFNPVSVNPGLASIFVLAPVNSAPAFNFGVVTIFCDELGKREEITSEAHSSPLFPNPASSEIQLTIEEESGATVEIYDLKGQLMKASHLPIGRSELSVEDLGIGLYLVRVSGAKGLRTHRLVIAR